MSTPPPYPFRSRREIHSGEPKVYSDAELTRAACIAGHGRDTRCRELPAVTASSRDDVVSARPRDGSALSARFPLSTR